MIKISEDKLIFRYSRSSGPGGQNVNKVNTRVTVFFDVAVSGSFTDIEKERILRRLSSRANKNSVIHVVSQRYRTQAANRQAAVERLYELLSEAVKPEPVRKRRRVPASARRRRLEEKRQRSLLKQQRAKRI
ncbi:MAG: alternative ribosome rescue aminoacyl-tRNA hydrolase ArfB, partial [Planctomycetota bacterium]